MISYAIVSELNLQVKFNPRRNIEDWNRNRFLRQKCLHIGKNMNVNNGLAVR